jgi:hypothetical protein
MLEAEDDLSWVEPWERVDPDTAARLEAELQRELPPGHVLQDKTVSAVARRIDKDDVAYALSDGTWAIVHLTHQRENDVQWPNTSLLSSTELGDRINRDHAEYAGPV